MAGLVKPSTQRSNPRQPTKTTPSIVTLHQTRSFSPQNGMAQRQLSTGLRTRSPNENVPMTSYFSSRQYTSEQQKRISPESTRRSSAFYYRPDSKNGLSEATTNVNRWSQSTASSKRTSLQLQRRSSATKGQPSTVGTFSIHSPDGTSATQNYHSHKRPRSPFTIPATAARVSPASENPPPLLPPIATLSSLSRAVDAADSPSSVNTPATADLLSPALGKSRDQDYFGSQWAGNPSSVQVARVRPGTSGNSTRTNSGTPSNFSVASSKLPESVYSPRNASFSKREQRRSSGHRRRRTSSTKSIGTTEGDSSASDRRDVNQKNRKRKAPSQKALLSKALAKANHAVVLDGKQNVEGAILAYNDACALLRQVMVRSSGEDDRRKLEAVRNTYKNRIVELQTSDPTYGLFENKALPDRPPERDSAQTELTIVSDEDDELPRQSRGSIPFPHDSGYGSGRYKSYQSNAPSANLPPRRQSLHTSPFIGADGQEWGEGSRNGNKYLQAPLYGEDVPQPLSPHRASPVRPQSPIDPESGAEKSVNESHTSWLNTINESDDDSGESVHSRRSSVGLRRRKLRAASGETEAEFEKALDAAIELAYDDGFEPDDEAEDEVEPLLEVPPPEQPLPKRFSAMKRNIEKAKQTIWEVERETAMAQAKQRERDRLRNDRPSAPFSLGADVGDDGEEEERMLEEMTRDFVLGDAEFDKQTKSALPRQSDSSGFSGRTWGSMGSNPTSATTSLSPLTEGRALPSLASQLQSEREKVPPLVYPPPSGALPPPPAAPGQTPSLASHAPQRNSLTQGNFSKRTSSPSVRERRLSGMKAKELKIETHSRHTSAFDGAPKTQPPPIPAPMIAPQSVREAPQSAFGIDESLHVPPSPMIESPPTSAIYLPGRVGSMPYTGSDTGEPMSSTTSALTKVTSADSDTLATSMPNSPARFSTRTTGGLRKNFSSSSLRSKSLSVNEHDTSPNTSVSSMGSGKVRRVPSPAVPVLPTPIETSFLPKGQPIGGSYLFENDIHSPLSPGSPNPLANNAPLPLEPCPESSLLRPFWFLRTIYQTIAHPRGGYLTNRMFIPRDIWRVKNIKLKNVEEKVSTCDLLTAALLKLAKVDTYNADAVLEEMQFLENIMERAQTNLSKKLGSEVGVQGALTSFKGVNTADESASNSEAIAPGNTNNKSYLKGWRKLRTKNSLGPHTTPGNPASAIKHDLKDAPSMHSLPMSASQNKKFPRRDVSQVQCVGPNPSYMGALARLCDAAQILDQIGRQVEDPGLKHSSPTHVGLELCTRHAAEFFGFYICRFVLADIGLMMDKFVKRSSEWVLT